MNTQLLELRKMLEIILTVIAFPKSSIEISLSTIKFCQIDMGRYGYELVTRLRVWIDNWIYKKLMERVLAPVVLRNFVHAKHIGI
jgi:hypothetical protein